MIVPLLYDQVQVLYPYSLAVDPDLYRQVEYTVVPPEHRAEVIYLVDAPDTYDPLDITICNAHIAGFADSPEMDSVVVVLDCDADVFVSTVAGTFTSAVAKLVTS